MVALRAPSPASSPSSWVSGFCAPWSSVRRAAALSAAPHFNNPVPQAVGESQCAPLPPVVFIRPRDARHPPATLSRSGYRPPSCYAAVSATRCWQGLQALGVGVVCPRALARRARRTTPAHNPLQHGISSLLSRSEIPRCSPKHAAPVQRSCACLAAPHPLLPIGRRGEW